MKTLDIKYKAKMFLLFRFTDKSGRLIQKPKLFCQIDKGVNKTIGQKYAWANGLMNELANSDNCKSYFMV